MAAEPVRAPRGAPALFHICRPDDWHAGQAAGHYGGTAIDARDGFIHFSSAAQLPGTAARHFAGTSGLVVLEVLRAALEDAVTGAGARALRWERSPDGALFPHFYGTVALDWVVGLHELELGHDGRHLFPFLGPGRPEPGRAEPGRPEPE